jgi:hypothetical protein
MLRHRLPFAHSTSYLFVYRLLYIDKVTSLSFFPQLFNDLSNVMLSMFPFELFRSRVSLSFVSPRLISS